MSLSDSVRLRATRAARTSVLTLIQRFGRALIANINFHMLCLDGLRREREWIEHPILLSEGAHESWAPQLTYTFAHWSGVRLGHTRSGSIHVQT